MNAQRHKKLLAVLSQLEDALAIAKDNLRKIKGEEQECFDNLPESLQEGDKAQRMLNITEMIQALTYSLEEAENNSRALRKE